MMGFEPLMQVANEARSGDICLPWPVVAAILTPLSAAVIYQTKRIVTLTDRMEKRYDEFLAQQREQKHG